MYHDVGSILCLKLYLNGNIHVLFQLFAIRPFQGIESNVFVDISKSTFLQKIMFGLSMDSYSHMYQSFWSIFAVNIVLYSMLIEIHYDIPENNVEIALTFDVNEN